ncbi:alpha/beta fold hydrolase [Novosphingobium sp.]|uniref:alpha/beta fold hydrolase n=1 Tax=Novosphingobium sp. TaxID=1874826 RepID=UPI00261A4249|nr:alpha/beta fold hydrolase [Novosphingobium sp.]
MAETAPQGHFADVGGVCVHYHDIGTGPELVLLHGSGPGATGWSNYNRNVEALSAHFRLLIPDLPGFGLSDMKPVDASTPGWWSKVIVGLLDELGIEKAHFVGNSMGGMVTLKIALEQPGRIDRMLLMGPGGGHPVFSTWPTPGIINLIMAYEGEGITAEKVRGFISASLFNQAAVTDELVQQRLEAALDPRVVAQPPMRPGPGGPPEDLWRDARLTRLPHETLIVWGREDRVLPLDTGMILMKQIPRATLTVVPQCGHWVMWEQWAEFNRIALSFFGANS